MEIKILNSVLFKELMPWTFQVKGIKAINEKIKKTGSKAPLTASGINCRLSRPFKMAIKAERKQCKHFKTSLLRN